MVPIDPDSSLAQRLEGLGDIAACSRELSSGEEVGVLFPAEPHSQARLHIVVKCPDVVVVPQSPPSLLSQLCLLHLLLTLSLSEALNV